MAISILRRMTTEEAMLEYADHYERASGYRVPTDYLARSVVYGFRRRGRTIGGVVMSASPPFRTLQRIPAQAQPAVRKRVRPDDTVELTCVWLDQELRRGALSAVFWLGLFLETSRHGARNVMFGTESPGLHRLYLCGHPEVVYEGPVVVDGKEQQGWIFLSPVSHRWPALARMTVYKSIRDLRRRLPGARPVTSAAMPVAARGQQDGDGRVALDVHR